MTDIKLISPATEAKPETIVIAEVEGIYENTIEPIHVRTEESGTCCAMCGAYALVWTDSIIKWEQSEFSCLK